MTKQNCVAISLAMAAVGLSSPVWAQSPAGFVRNPTFSSPSLSPFSNVVGNSIPVTGAKPIVNPLGAPDTSEVRAQTADKVQSVAPGFKLGSDPVAETAPGTRAFGTFGIPYSSTRVQLGGTAFASSVGPSFLSTTVPYRRIGKLFLTGGYCSASLIRRSVIVTAAHCIQNFGSGNTSFGGWIYVPGHYAPVGATTAQSQPYGQWTWRAFSRPVTWMSGADTGSGAARNNDLAVIILGKNGAGKFVGDVTGWLGYSWNNYSFTSSAKTGNLKVAATSTLGYPFLMDGGAMMQRADGPSYLTTVGGADQIWQGNNFTGGSSGGPWIVNFVTANPVLSGGAVVGASPKLAVIGVTSWGSADPNTPKDNYSSRFGQNTEYPNASYGVYGAGNIGALLQQACSQIDVPGTTFAAAGYCD